MNYLTNYYKNLSEQLQERLNILEAQISESNQDPTNMNTSPVKLDGKGYSGPSPEYGISPKKSKRTPEQDKAIKEWEAKYGLFAKGRPKGKSPPRPYDPDKPEEPTIG